jgi:2-haloacid dehalogenase
LYNVIDATQTKPLIVFDVNETLLDLETLVPLFERVLGDRLAMRLWFSNLILYSETLTLSSVYVPFTEIGSAVLKMLAASRGRTVSDDDARALTEAFSTMPPHADVPGALRRLREAGFRLFTLTDNLLEVQTRQLERGGISGYFEQRFSVDAARTHKPSRDAYRLVQDRLAATPAELLLVASHTWDTIGALSSGWSAALIERPGNAPLSVGPQPEFIGKDLDAIANQLIERYE